MISADTSEARNGIAKQNTKDEIVNLLREIQAPVAAATR
jgi:hypothetical protein